MTSRPSRDVEDKYHAVKRINQQKHKEYTLNRKRLEELNKIIAAIREDSDRMLNGDDVLDDSFQDQSQSAQQLTTHRIADQATRPLVINPLPSQDDKDAALQERQALINRFTDLSNLISRLLEEETKIKDQFALTSQKMQTLEQQQKVYEGQLKAGEQAIQDKKSQIEALEQKVVAAREDMKEYSMDSVEWDFLREQNAQLELEHKQLDYPISKYQLRLDDLRNTANIALVEAKQAETDVSSTKQQLIEEETQHLTTMNSIISQLRTLEEEKNLKQNTTFRKMDPSLQKALLSLVPLLTSGSDGSVNAKDIINEVLAFQKTQVEINLAVDKRNEQLEKNRAIIETTQKELDELQKKNTTVTNALQHHIKIYEEWKQSRLKQKQSEETRLVSLLQNHQLFKSELCHHQIEDGENIIALTIHNISLPTGMTIRNCTPMSLRVNFFGETELSTNKFNSPSKAQQTLLFRTFVTRELLHSCSSHPIKLTLFTSASGSNTRLASGTVSLAGLLTSYRAFKEFAKLVGPQGEVYSASITTSTLLPFDACCEAEMWGKYQNWMMEVKLGLADQFSFEGCALCDQIQEEKDQEITSEPEDDPQTERRNMIETSAAQTQTDNIEARESDDDNDDDEDDEDEQERNKQLEDLRRQEELAEEDRRREEEAKEEEILEERRRQEQERLQREEEDRLRTEEEARLQSEEETLPNNQVTHDRNDWDAEEEEEEEEEELPFIDPSLSRTLPSGYGTIRLDQALAVGVSSMSKMDLDDILNELDKSSDDEEESQFLTKEKETREENSDSDDDLFLEIKSKQKTKPEATSTFLMFDDRSKDLSSAMTTMAQTDEHETKFNQMSSEMGDADDFIFKLEQDMSKLDNLIGTEDPQPESDISGQKKKKKKKKQAPVQEEPEPVVEKKPAKNTALEDELFGDIGNDDENHEYVGQQTDENDDDDLFDLLAGASKNKPKTQSGGAGADISKAELLALIQRADADDDD
ncbi:hypothetical protein BLNAU_8181 [Blattamonas nauphoetae]|uniref:Uncharacterized protein n=1 Tax=Blattamonas nauphoetae TaxID=2049346 RepID=A0ABQ9XZN8_9EUKA|nr:hypothetical protein BLNAU_8181 [Blattamonas nauphoetae]